MHFEIFQEGDADGRVSDGYITRTAWRWRLKASDGETIMTGERYEDHAQCLSAVYLVRRTNSHTPIRDV